MLAEMYVYLKDEFPSHGLEIVFISSDRDLRSFNQYYASMPWAAVPFDSPSYAGVKQMLSMKYGVRGIPSFVVLDAVSGEVVASADASRREVVDACRRGDAGIESLLRDWLDSAPAETKELLNMLELSCAEENSPTDADAKEAADNPYLVRSTTEGLETPKAPTKEETAAKVKAKFAKLVREGMTPNEAAAKAIEAVASAASSAAENDGGDERAVDVGPLNGQFIAVNSVGKNDGGGGGNDNGTDTDEADRCLDRVLQVSGADNNDDDDVYSALSTALKYAQNVADKPWTAKFRTFKLSNKVADRITRTPGGAALVKSVGFDVVLDYSGDDFCVSIPVAIDVERSVRTLRRLLERVRPTTGDKSDA